MKYKHVSKKPYAVPEMVVYGSVPTITRESSYGWSLDAPIQAGQAFGDATLFS